jgi:hypothetical protein
MIGTFYPPRAWARKVVPDAFDLKPGLFPQTASFQFDAVHCNRLAADEQVHESQSLFRILVDVSPKNASWAPGSSSYVTDVLVSSREVAAAASAMGVQARHATLSRSIVPAGTGTVEHWTYTGQRFTADLEFSTKGERIDGGRTPQTTWHTMNDTFRKVHVDTVYEYDTFIVQSGALRLTGPFAVSPALPGECCIEWLGASYTQWAEVWAGNRTVYPT